MGMFRDIFQPSASRAYPAAMQPAPPSAADIIRAELKRRRISHRELGEMVGLGEAAVTKKLSRGGFDAEWFLLVLRRIGARDLRLD